MLGAVCSMDASMGQVACLQDRARAHTHTRGGGRAECLCIDCSVCSAYGRGGKWDCD
jgi:hypothetical protein